MKICITSQGNNLDAQIDPRFGRCKYFLIVDTDTLEFDSIKNPNVDAVGGAGIQSGQIIVNNGVKVVITGNVGPNAYKTIHAAGIDVIAGAEGVVKEVIERYKKGELKAVKAPTTESHFGMNRKYK